MSLAQASDQELFERFQAADNRRRSLDSCFGYAEMMMLSSGHPTPEDEKELALMRLELARIRGVLLARGYMEPTREKDGRWLWIKG